MTAFTFQTHRKKMDHSSSCSLGEEVNRLKTELETATLQRCQAAEQGLMLLAQKEQMQQQLEEAESRIEQFRLELEHSREVSQTCMTSGPQNGV